MKDLPTLLLGCLALTAPAPPAGAQPAPPAAAGSFDALVKEIRLLRQALERQSVAAARAQLLIGRLTLQDQRTARARQAVERLESELSGAEQERRQLETAFRETARALEQAADEAQRQALERESRMVRARLADQQAHVSRTEARLSQARQALDGETGRYDELDGWLRDMDEQLERGW